MFWVAFLIVWGGAYSIRNVIITFYIRDSSSDNLDCYKEWFTKAWWGHEVSWESWEQATRFFPSPIHGSKYNRLHHAQIIMYSRIWFELSDQRDTPPHVTRKVAQNTRPSSCMCREGLSTRARLGLEVDPVVNCVHVFVCTYRRHKGHTCDRQYCVVSIVLWEGLSSQRSSLVYQQLTDLLPKYGNPTQRRCESNERSV